MFARRPTLAADAGLSAFTAPAFSGDTSSPQAAQQTETHDEAKRAAAPPAKRPRAKRR